MFSDNIWRDLQQEASYQRSDVDRQKLKSALTWLSTQSIEHMLVAFYNSRNFLITIEEVGRGARHEVSIEPDEVFRRCVVLSAKGFIAAHNHPEGGPLPSRQDIALTQRMIARGAMLDIHMLDSLIVDDRGVCNSLRQTKAIDPWYPARPWAHNGPAIAKAILELDRNLADQAEEIRPFVEGPGLKVLLALYLTAGGKLLHEISLATGLARSTVSRVLKGLLMAGLAANISPAAKPKFQRYRMTDYGYAVTESLLRGDEVARPQLVPA